jgi:hypothetical protein
MGAMFVVLVAEVAHTSAEMKSCACPYWRKRLYISLCIYQYTELNLYFSTMNAGRVAV